MSSIFSLTDAIGKSDRINSLALLKNMCDQGTNEILILTMIARHFKILLKIKALKNRNKSEIASSLKINPYFINNYMDQASRISFEKVFKFYKEICNTDFLLKSTRSSSYQVIENLILTY